MSFLGTAVEAIGEAVNAIVPGFTNLTNQSGGKDYDSFRTRLFETQEYQALADDAARDAHLKYDLSRWIKNELGPIYGENINKYLNDSTNDNSFALVKFLSKNKSQFEGIISNLTKIDADHYKHGGSRDEQIDALINLQANSLLALVKPDVTPAVAAGLDAISTDIKKKIDAANDLFQVPLIGGSNDDRDLIKYMKYKAKYLKLKSKMQ